MDTVKELSFGEKSVGLTFNPSGDPFVTQLKHMFATIIDACHEQREKTDDHEKKRLYSLAITEAQAAQMWTVKAVTWGK